MPIQSLNFGSTHSWSDHGTVKSAADVINQLPLYHGGSFRVGNSVQLSQIEQAISGFKTFQANQEKTLETQRCNGFNAETMAKTQKVIDDIRSYISSLETIRDYMKSYTPCRC